MEKLREWYYGETPQDTLGDVEVLTAAFNGGALYKDSLLSLYGEGNKPRKRGSILRWSSMGKPAVDLFAQKFFRESTAHVKTTNKQKRIFLLGHEFECWLDTALRSAGYEVLNKETKVSLYGVTGHCDFLVRHKSEPSVVYVLEAKTSSHGYFSRLLKDGLPHRYSHSALEQRGYVTQLAAYTEAIRRICANDDSVREVRGYWVVLDKQEQELGIIPLNQRWAKKKLQRAQDIVTAWNTITEWDDVFAHFCPPMPIPEKWRGSTTGRYLVPQQCTFSNWKQYYYVLNEALDMKGRPRTYVEDFRFPERYKHLKPTL